MVAQSGIVSFSKVKYHRALSPHGWYYRYVLYMDLRMRHGRQHACKKIRYTRSKIIVVHVRVWWVMENTKIKPHLIPKFFKSTKGIRVFKLL